MSDQPQPQQQQQQKSQTQAKPAAPPQIAATPTPGLDQVKAIRADGDAGTTAVVQVLRAYPDERQPIMTWLQQNRGNSFVQAVSAKQGQMEKITPAGFEMKSATATVVIPKGKQLYGSWKADVITREDTEITIEVNHSGVTVTMRPPLFVDGTFPLARNASVFSAGVNFSDGKPYAEVEGSGLGAVNTASIVHGMVLDTITKGIAGSPITRPGYDPDQDPDLVGTSSRLVHAFTALFASPTATKKPGGFGPKDLTQVSMGATVSAKAEQKLVKDGTGLDVLAGSDLNLQIQGSKSIADLATQSNVEGVLEAAQIQAVRLQTEGLTVQVSGKPLVQIKELTLHAGGAVTVEQMALMGAVKQASGIEAGLSALVGLMALHSGDPSTKGLLDNAANPQVVDGITRALIEKEFTENVQKLIIQYRNAVPGIDLARALGIG